jgi:hypothetical protein
MSKRLSEEDLKKELVAQKKRALAQAYLDKNGCGPGKVENALNKSGEAAALEEDKKAKKSGDNTLDLLIHKKVLNETVERQKNVEMLSRNALIKQQEDFRNKNKEDKPITNLIDTSNILPTSWEAVLDKTSGDYAI